MNDILHVLHESALVGTLVYNRKKDEITWSYEETWQFGAESFPVSLSLPLSKKAHPDESIRPFLQGLLPDNPAVIEAWGKRFQVSPRNPFDVIKHVGEDCAGALQFIRPERLDLILSGKLDSLTPLTDEALEKRMSDLQSQSRAVPVFVEGRFSLAGAQTKDALYQKGGRWYIPGGRIPSTHILKPEMDEFDHHALNEHFCLKLAAKAGLRSSESRITEIGGKRVLCIERYDRVSYDDAGTIRRMHQEDTCQALGRYPHQKYQADGGPSAAEIVKLLDRSSDDDEADTVAFVGALAFNWVIAGTDAHSKNFSLLHGPGSFLRMAPLYDLASFLPYQLDPNSTKVKLAMKIGGTYRLHQIDSSSWKAWASEAGCSPEGVLEIVRIAIDRISEVIDDTRAMVAETNDIPFLHSLADVIAERTRKCAECID